MLGSSSSCRSEFTDPDDLQRLDAIASEAQRYQQHFEELAALWTLKVKTRSGWVEAGNTSDALIAELETRWAGTPDDPVMHESRHTAALGLLAGEVSKHNRRLRASASESLRFGSFQAARTAFGGERSRLEEGRIVPTDPKLVPYGCLMAAFHAAPGCLPGPSSLSFVMRAALG